MTVALGRMTPMTRHCLKSVRAHSNGANVHVLSVPCACFCFSKEQNYAKIHWHKACVALAVNHSFLRKMSPDASTGFESDRHDEQDAEIGIQSPSFARPLLDFSAVSHSYSGTRGETLALEHVNLSIQAGEFVSIVGSSGCGKSTLLRIASGLLEPTKGAALIDGNVVSSPRSDVGMIFQDAVMLPWFSVIENVTLPIRVAKGDMAAARREAARLLDRVGLAGFHDAVPSELSGGMRQRAAIVRALLSRPRLLLMDEPFGALDALTREQMNLELAGIAEESGCAVLLITHSISEAVFLSDRTVVMSPRPGRVADDIPVSLARPRSAATLRTPAFAALCHRVRQHFMADEEHP